MTNCWPSYQPHVMQSCTFQKHHYRRSPPAQSRINVSNLYICLREEEWDMRCFRSEFILILRDCFYLIHNDRIDSFDFTFIS